MSGQKRIHPQGVESELTRRVKALWVSKTSSPEFRKNIAAIRQIVLTESHDIICLEEEGVCLMQNHLRGLRWSLSFHGEQAVWDRMDTYFDTEGKKKSKGFQQYIRKNIFFLMWLMQDRVLEGGICPVTDIEDIFEELEDAKMKE